MMNVLKRSRNLQHEFVQKYQKFCPRSRRLIFFTTFLCILSKCFSFPIRSQLGKPLPHILVPQKQQPCGLRIQYQNSGKLFLATSSRELKKTYSSRRKNSLSKKLKRAISNVSPIDNEDRDINEASGKSNRINYKSQQPLQMTTPLRAESKRIESNHPRDRSPINASRRRRRSNNSKISTSSLSPKLSGKSSSTSSLYQRTRYYKKKSRPSINELPTKTLSELTKILDKQLHSKGPRGAGKDFPVLNGLVQHQRDSMSSLLGYNYLGGDWRDHTTNTGSSGEVYAAINNSDSDFTDKEKLTRHVVILFGKKLINDQLTVEYASRIRTLVKLFKNEPDLFRPSLICFCSASEDKYSNDLNYSDSVDDKEKGSRNKRRRQRKTTINNADAGYTFFRHLCQAQQVDLSGISFFIDNRSENDKQAVQRVTKEVTQSYLLDWFTRSNKDFHFDLDSNHYDDDDYFDSKHNYKDRRQKSIEFSSSLSKKIHIHFTLMSTEYHLCNVNDIHHRSPRNSILKDIEDLAQDFQHQIILKNDSSSSQDYDYFDKDDDYQYNEEEELNNSSGGKNEISERKQLPPPPTYDDFIEENEETMMSDEEFLYEKQRDPLFKMSYRNKEDDDDDYDYLSSSNNHNGRKTRDRSVTETEITKKTRRVLLHGTVETSWSFQYSTYPFIGASDDAIAFLGKCFLLGQELTPLYVNMKGVVDKREFFQHDNYLMLASIRRSFVSHVEELYKGRKTILCKKLNVFKKQQDLLHNPTSQYQDINREKSRTSQSRGTDKGIRGRETVGEAKPYRSVEAVLESALLHLGRSLDLVRPASAWMNDENSNSRIVGSSAGLPKKVNWDRALNELELSMKEIKSVCDPDQPLDYSEWGKLYAIGEKEDIFDSLDAAKTSGHIDSDIDNSDVRKEVLLVDQEEIDSIVSSDDEDEDKEPVHYFVKEQTG